MQLFQSTRIETKLSLLESDAVTVNAALSLALSAELDAMGYLPAPARYKVLAEALGLKRIQTYRMLTGLNAPSPDFLAALRSLGVSVDRALDRATARVPTTVDVLIEGKPVTAIFQRNPKKITSSVVAITNPHGQFELRALTPGDAIPADAIPIQGLQFPTRLSLAIVEDDADTLVLLAQQMGSAFHVASFEGGLDLLNVAGGLQAFAAFLIDWRLPDIDGEELVKKVRKSSLAPIFVLTGDKSASASIAKALDYENVHHVAKPVDEIILIKRIMHAAGAAA